MTTRAERRQREREKAKSWWSQLTPDERFDLGDQLVLGCFNWQDWGFSKPPSSTFLNEVDDPVEACKVGLEKSRPGGALVICGSFFLAAETRGWLAGQTVDFP